MTVLHGAARSGDVARLAAALDAGADPDEPDDLGRSPLTVAAAAGRATAVDLLLAHGADPDLAGPDGETPLSAASAQGRRDVVARLLRDRRTDPTRHNERGWDPLTTAAFAGHTTVVAALLADARTRVGARDGQGRTALWWAATGGRDEVARLLADRPGAEVPDDDGVDPASAASAAGHADLAAALHARPRLAAEELAEENGPDDRDRPPDDASGERPAGRVTREPAWRFREGR